MTLRTLGIGLFLLPFVWITAQPTVGFAEPCRSRRGHALFVFPERPVAGKPLYVVALSQDPHPNAALQMTAASRTTALKATHRGGPPYYHFAQLTAPAAGPYRAWLTSEGGEHLGCQPFRVAEKATPYQAKDHWPIERAWSAAMEDLYSAWIETLFFAAANERPSWLPLDQAFHDANRNFLYDALGAHEDSGGAGQTNVVAKPDCADLPYFLRAYFAWKLRLPFGYRHCTRGTASRPPTCTELRTNRGALVSETDADPANAFSRFLRADVSYVHSASGRTVPENNASDLYPVAMTRKSIRPGSVYVDEYGHLLIVARWVPQGPKSSGLLFAVDGHPDLSVGRKRFWRGSFMFIGNTKVAGCGFKRFRPIIEDGSALRTLTNEEIVAHADYGDYSLEQYERGQKGFYERMDRLINPNPLSPTHAYQERLKALHEVLLERVDSVAAGETYLKKTDYAVVEMPDGPRIFETRGPWEDYSTPARDFRLLIAIDEVLGYPDKVIAHPDWFALAPNQSPSAAREMMRQLGKQFMENHFISYVRSDGQEQRLSLAEVIGRQKELEMAYNPNDCIEIRWGETGNGLATCQRHAPTEHVERMKTYREWFATRTRPAIRQ